MKHIYEPDTPMVTRDGVSLVADVWHPMEGQAPTLIVRSPYGRTEPFHYGSQSGNTPSLIAMVNAGYAVVLQDVRGTGASDGDFQPKISEQADGQDTAKWVREQSWSDGTVAIYGASYMGMAAWGLAMQATDGLRAAAPTVSATDWYTNLWYSPGGALSLSLATYWHSLMYAGLEHRALMRGTTRDPSALARLAATLPDPLALNDATPVADLPVIGKGRWLDDWIAHPDYDEYWTSQDWSGPESMSRVSVPVLLIGGWYDLKIDGTVQGFVGVRSHGATADARDKSRLIIGPWSHADFSDRFADRQFGSAAVIDTTAEHISFFDEHVKGVTPEKPAPPVQIFVMGIDEWREELDWPLPDTHYTDYYLTSGGSANTRDGDGSLQASSPTDQRSDGFRYDPRNPVPTAGGALLPDIPGLIGPVDQRAVDGRDDVLCYATPVLTEPVEVTGSVELTLHVSASTVDTDITAKLVDVFPDGRAINLCDGILRLRYRTSLSEPELMTPGQVYEVTVPMSVTANVFLPGHRIRLDISGSNFPRFDRNSNTGGVIASEALDDMIVSDTTIHHGGARPSRLRLPIIDR